MKAQDIRLLREAMPRIRKMDWYQWRRLGVAQRRFSTAVAEALRLPLIDQWLCDIEKKLSEFLRRISRR